VIDTIETIEKPLGTKYRLANLTSNILNPFLVGVALIVLFSFKATATTGEAVKWALLTASVGLLPLTVIIIYLLRQGKLDDFFISAREQRTRIYLMGTVSTVAGLILLSRLQAPQILLSGFIAAISVMVIFMLINLWWKISVHTGFIAASSAILVMLYGWAAAATIALIPLTAWSRVKLDRHSLAQAIGGAVLATVIAIIVYYPLASA
jgi:membrane-associated phospholipid phosphatase